MTNKKIIAAITLMAVLFSVVGFKPINVKADTASTYVYKNEYGTPKWVTAKGYAAGQPSKGTRFKTGGGFYYQDSNSKTISSSVSFPLKNFGTISIGIPIGKVGGSIGNYIKAPDQTNYWKLYVTKKYKVKPYITYRKLRYGNDKWKVYYKGYVIMENKIAFDCKKVTK